jgi:hypothetical protein
MVDGPYHVIKITIVQFNRSCLSSSSLLGDVVVAVAAAWDVFV